MEGIAQKIVDQMELVRVEKSNTRAERVMVQDLCLQQGVSFFLCEKYVFVSYMAVAESPFFFSGTWQ